MKTMHMLEKYGKYLKKKTLVSIMAYVQSDTILLEDVFENFRNNSINKYELDPAHFLSAPGLAWQVCLKKNRSRIRVINR